MTWTRCLLDHGWHAIDERRDHPDGVLETECGHLLPMAALHDEPSGRPCPACAAQQLTRAQTTTASTATCVSGQRLYTTAADALTSSPPGAVIPRQDQ